MTVNTAGMINLFCKTVPLLRGRGVSVSNLLVLHKARLQYTLRSLWAYTPHLGFYRRGIARAMLKKDSKRKLFQMILRTGKQYIYCRTHVILISLFMKKAYPACPK
jgi:hypothetical protein